MKRFSYCLSLAILGSLILVQKPVLAAEHSKQKADASIHERGSAVALRMTMRKLWEDHITYTRNYIISALADLPDADAVAKRLLKNQDDIGNAIKPYYGAEAGTKLSELLRDHITIATEVVKAAKADNKPGLEASQKKWTGNGKDIAAFLSNANPN